MATLEDLYPFSTHDGKHIPLDIIKPAGLIITNVGLTPDVVVIPANVSVATIFSIHATLGLQADAFPPSVDDAVFYEGMFWIPPLATMTIALEPGNLYLRTIDDVIATVYIQFITKWAGLALARQYTKK